MFTGIQISSLKKLLTNREAVTQVMLKLKSIGFTHAQLQWIDKSIQPSEIAEGLLVSGLIPLGTQEKYDECMRDLDYFIRLNRACKTDEICISGIPDRYEGFEGIMKYTEEVRGLYNRLAGEGIRLSYHPVKNDFRYSGGKPSAEIVLDEIPMLEIVPDTNQLMRASMDVCAFITRYAGRMRMIHFKDMESTLDSAPLTPVGRGCTPFPSFMPDIMRADIRYLLVEQETWSDDPFLCMQESWCYVQSMVYESNLHKG